MMREPQQQQQQLWNSQPPAPRQQIQSQSFANSNSRQDWEQLGSSNHLQLQQQQVHQHQQPINAVYAGAPADSFEAVAFQIGDRVDSVYGLGWIKALPGTNGLPDSTFSVLCDNGQQRALHAGGLSKVEAYRQNQNGLSPDFGQMEAQRPDHLRGATSPYLDLLCAGPHTQDLSHAPVGAGISKPSMSVEEMRLFMQDEGVPLFVYNKQLETEPKRLLLDPLHSILSLVDNEIEDDIDTDRANREPCASFELADLEEIQLGEQCNFARLLQPTYDTSDPLLMAMMEPQAPTDRLAAFKFAEAGGCLCVRFLSSTLKDAAIDVFREICPHVRIVGN